MKNHMSHDLWVAYFSELRKAMELPRCAQFIPKLIQRRICSSGLELIIAILKYKKIQLSCDCQTHHFHTLSSSKTFFSECTISEKATLSYIFLHVDKIHSQVSVLSFFTIAIVNWSLDYLSILRVSVSFVQVSRRVYNIKY